jgi:hypothetical protein
MVERDDKFAEGAIIYHLSFIIKKSSFHLEKLRHQGATFSFHDTQF